MPIAVVSLYRSCFDCVWSRCSNTHVLMNAERCWENSITPWQIQSKVMLLYMCEHCPLVVKTTDLHLNELGQLLDIIRPATVHVCMRREVSFLASVLVSPSELCMLYSVSAGFTFPSISITLIAHIYFTGCIILCHISALMVRTNKHFIG